MIIASELKVRRVGGDWHTVEINDPLYGHGLCIDLATSKFDKRDWIISKRKGFTLEQDSGFMYSYSKRGYTLAELKIEILDIAKEIAESLAKFDKQSLESAIASVHFSSAPSKCAVSK